MDLAVTILFFTAGLVLIVKGGDWFVDSAAWMAKVSGIPEFIIGATIVSVATTLPELITSLIATLQGKVDLAVGNAVGSVAANTGLILGISLLFIPSAIRRRKLAPKVILLLAANVILFFLTSGGTITIAAGLILIAVFASFLWENVASARMCTEETRRAPLRKEELPHELLLFVGGTAGIVLGANLLVEHGSSLAIQLGVPESTVALTLVAIGTSLPELVTALTAIVKKQGSMSVGNIIGANIIDLALIMPACAMVSGGTLTVSRQTHVLDIPICIVLICIAMLPALIAGQFRRWQGILLLVVYFSYLAVLIL